MPGGTRSYEMARRLVRTGYKVNMVTTDQQGEARGRFWKESTESGICVHWAHVHYNNRMGFWGRVIAFVSFAVMATLKTTKLEGDIIFATSTPLTIAIPALLVSTWKRIPFVFEVRDMWPDVPIAIGAIRNPMLVWLTKWLERMTYRRASHIVALAPGMRDDIIAKGVPAEKITVIPNGCDLDVFTSSERGGSPRTEFAWLGDRKMLIYAGALGLVNGVDYLVRLAHQVARLDPEIRFVVIGSGRERDAIRSLAVREGVLDRNYFMFGPMPKRELARWLSTADMAVALFTGPRAVWKDAVQNKFFDALAAGKPIANNFDGWQSRVAAEADVGLILNPEDTVIAAQDLVNALHDETWLAGVPGRARILAEGRFNRDRLAEQLEHVLEEVIRSKP